MREKRFAVVMNGGVSLAVWMGGVTHELNRVRLASGDWEPTDPDEAAVHRAWRAILEKSRTRVVVDAIAGTSAGGLNGALLATAIARGGELDGLRTIWFESASLEPGKLLREDPTDAPTVLDGGFFADEINAALASVSDAESTGTHVPPQEVTLLVTATAVGSSLAPVALEGGFTDRYIDSRRVFRFRRRLPYQTSMVSAEAVEPQVVDDFVVPMPLSRDGVPAGSLARAARASASFPVAFEPVMEDDALVEHRVSSVFVGRRPLMDGGVLDNAPFGPLIEELRQRPVDAPFDRVLLYVVPSARARQLPPLGEANLPDVSKVLGALTATVREPDQRLDIELLENAFDQMSYQRTTAHATLADLITAGDDEREQMATAALALLERYRIGRAEAVHRWLSGLGGYVDLTFPRPVDPDPDRFRVIPAARNLAVASLTPGQPWEWGSSTADRVLRWLGRAMVARAAEVDDNGDGDGLLATAFETIGAAQRRVAEVDAELVTRLATRVEVLPEFEDRASEFTLLIDELADHDPIGTAVGRAADAVAAWLRAQQHDTSAAKIIDSALQIEVVSSVFSWGGDEGDVPAFTYLQASPAAPNLIEIPAVTELVGTPDYDNALRQWAGKKLFGERWGHFGAFATKKGRQHDWLWGRLDGASTLADILLGEEDGEGLRAVLVEAILKAEGTTRGEVIVSAGKMVDLGNRDLLEQTMAEAEGEASRELLLRTVPELLGEASGVPAGAEEVAQVLAAAGEALADLVEVRDASRTWVRGLFHRVWHWRRAPEPDGRRG